MADGGTAVHLDVGVETVPAWKSGVALSSESSVAAPSFNTPEAADVRRCH